MLVYSPLAVAYFEALASNPAAGATTGRFYFNTADNVLKFYDNSAWVVVATTANTVSLTGAEVLTNKDLSDASNDLTGATATAFATGGGTASLPSGAYTFAKNVLTTRGDMLYCSATASPGTEARLAKGTTGKRLRSNANDPEWSFGSSSAQVASYVILDDDGFDTILMTTGGTNRTVTLPTPSANTGRRIAIVKTDSASGKCNILPDASETIGGTDIWQLSDKGDFVNLETDGTNWFAVGASGKFTPCFNAAENAAKAGVVKRKICVNGIADNAATTVFSIKTVNETGSNDGGSYAVFFRGVVGHVSTSTSSNSASKAFSACFTRTVTGDGATGVNSAVSEIVESASAATTGATRDISTLTMTVSETDEYSQAVQFTMDLTGSSVSTGLVVGEVEVHYYGFLTPPEIEVS